MTIYARHDDNILATAVITGTAPLTSYSLATLAILLPSARVRWGATSISIVFTLGAPALGDELVIPTSNLTPGSTTILALTNNAGLSKAITIAALQKSGIPKTTVFDIKAAEPNAATRTASVWTLTVTTNAANVQFGGAVLIYGPQRALTPNFLGSYAPPKTYAINEVYNEYLTRYVTNYRTQRRTFRGAVRALRGELAGFEDWFDAGFGRALPSLLWLPDIELDAYLGILQSDFAPVHLEGAGAMRIYDIPVVFEELAKGQPF